MQGERAEAPVDFDDAGVLADTTENRTADRNLTRTALDENRTVVRRRAAINASVDRDGVRVMRGKITSDAARAADDRTADGDVICMAIVGIHGPRSRAGAANHIAVHRHRAKIE